MSNNSRRRTNRRSGNDIKIVRVSKASALISSVRVVPDRMRVKLRYTDQGTFGTLTTGVGTQVYRLNSVFDPDFTSTGAQPSGFDQWGGFYNYYRVWACNVTVQVNFNGGTSSSSSCVISTSDTSTALVTVSQALGRSGQPYTSALKLNANGFLGPGCNGQVFQRNYSIPKLFGMRNAAFAGDPGFSSLITTNPSGVQYLHINPWVDNQSTSTTFFYLVTLDYDVEFYERANLGLSLRDRLDAMDVANLKRIQSKDRGDSKSSSNSLNGESDGPVYLQPSTCDQTPTRSVMSGRASVSLQVPFPHRQ